MTPSKRGAKHLCPDCGTKSGKAAKFCFNCGYSLNVGADPS